MKLVKKKKSGSTAHKTPAGKAKMKLVGKIKSRTKKKLTLIGKRKTSPRRVKKSLLGGKRKVSARGGPRQRSGRFSLFRPKVRGRAYPVQDNTAGWKLYDRLIKQSGLSGSDVFTLGMRLLAREFPELSKESAIGLAKRLNEHEFKLAS